MCKNSEMKMRENVVSAVFVSAGLALSLLLILAFILFWLVGPGGVIAVAEWPFGIGPFSTQGSYCTDMHRFAADISIATNNPSSGNISTVKTAYGNLISSAPNQTVVSDLNNWLSAEQSGDSCGDPV